MADKVIYAMYDDDDTLLNGAKHLVKEGVKVSDVYSPFPLHGIDPVIGVEPTRLGIAAFMYGLTGTMLAIIGIRYMMIVDWPRILVVNLILAYMKICFLLCPYFLNLPFFVPHMVWR